MLGLVGVAVNAAVRHGKAGALGKCCACVGQNLVQVVNVAREGEEPLIDDAQEDLRLWDPTLVSKDGAWGLGFDSGNQVVRVQGHTHCLMTM